LWNGLLGVRISRSSNGFGPDGKPLGFFMIDEYQPDGEEKLVDLPNPILVSWSVGNSIYNGDNSKPHDFIKSGGTPLDTSGTISDYRQTLDMKNGLLTTSWKQETDAAGTVGFQCETVVHPLARVIAQRWTLTFEKPSTFSVKSLDYSGPGDEQELVGGDGDQSIAISASKSRATTLQCHLSGANQGATSTISGFRVQEGTSLAGKPVEFERVIAFGPHSSKPLPEFTSKTVALLKRVAPAPMTFGEALNASKAEWAKRWKTDIEIQGPSSDQQFVRSTLFYLRSAIAPKLGDSISPFGLSNDQYNGHVFWDADVWVLPALDLIDPEEAKSIVDYRLKRESAAGANFRLWYKERLTKQGSGGDQPPVGVKFPWESSVTGKETAPGSSKIEDHITGSVVWGLTQAEALGIAPEKDVERVSALAANFFYSRGTHAPGTAQMSINQVMSPDENHIGNNDLYTNLLANWIVGGRTWSGVPAASAPLKVPHDKQAPLKVPHDKQAPFKVPHDKQAPFKVPHDKQAPFKVPHDKQAPFKVPHDKQGLITYDGDPLKSYKQAAAILSIYPLQFPPAEADAKQMMGRFESKVIKNGPAMSASLDALIWARAGDANKGYADWLKSWQPFADNPLLLFSEKRSKRETYFTTGAAGCLQAVLYGFLGFRVDSNSLPGSAWERPIIGHQVISLKPNLPPQWKSVTFKNFHVLNSVYTLVATHREVRVISGE
jgi:trehalose/maltose hydrolase-like predicted phosphorylase